MASASATAYFENNFSTATEVLDMDSGASYVRIEDQNDRYPHVTAVLDLETDATYAKINSDLRNFTMMTKHHVLGRGANGEVVLVENLVSSCYAAKMFLLDKDDEEKNAKTMATYHREVSILQNVDHRNIVDMTYCGVCPQYGMILMGYFPQGALYNHLKDLTNEQVMKYFINIVDAVNYLHGLRIVHRDIKLDNILCKNDDVVITDFGLSKTLPKDNNLVTDIVGTVCYMAPEILDASTIFYDGFKADAYSMGVFLWSLLMRTEPEPNTDCWDSLETECQRGTAPGSYVLWKSAFCLLQADSSHRMDITSLRNMYAGFGYYQENVEEQDV